jgi:hypothetical protein
MTLTTHALVGAAAASFFPAHPYAAFAAGFVSHFVIDALPHWDEAGTMLRSLQGEGPDRTNRDMTIGKDFISDISYLGFESLVGLLAAVFIFYAWLHVPLAIVLIGVVAGLLPDALHFVYFKTHSILLQDFERLHVGLQNHKTNKRYLFVEAALVVGVVLVRAMF